MYYVAFVLLVSNWTYSAGMPESAFLDIVCRKGCGGSRQVRKLLDNLNPSTSQCQSPYVFTDALVHPPELVAGLALHLASPA
eukprot:5346618-Amphidinium_carterae.1